MAVRRRVAIGSLVAVAALVQFGCFSVVPGAPSAVRVDGAVRVNGVKVFDTARGAVPAASDWPARWGDGGVAKGVVVEETRPLRSLKAVWLPRAMVLRADDEDRRDAAALARFGGADAGAGMRARFEGRGALLLAEPDRFRPPWRVDEDDAVKPEDPEPAAVFRFVSGVDARGVGAVPGVEVQRTWMAWYEPDGVDGVAARRTAIVLPGLFGEPRGLIGRMVGELLDDGWCVLRVMTPPSRYMERVEVELPGALFDEDGAGAGDGARRAAFDAVGVELARVFDDRFAEYAYAVEAGVRHVALSHGSVGRVALVGMSGGVWASSAGVARVGSIEGVEVRAVVLIGGGVDALGTGLASSYADHIGVLVLNRDGTEQRISGLSPRLIGELVASYVRASRLDVLKTAPAFGDAEVLVVDAAWDRIVPTVHGELLWRVAGQPERWTMRAGHLGLFFALPWFDGRLADWLDAAVPAADDAG